MTVKKQYIQVTLLSGRNYIGYVADDFSPNFNDDMSFILYNSHCFYTKLNKNSEPYIELIGIEDAPEGFAPDMEIMWQAVATVQYLKDNSYLVKSIENKYKNSETDDKKEPNLIVLRNDMNKKKKGNPE